MGYESVEPTGAFYIFPKSMNEDDVAKHHPFCSRCEARYGLGRLEAHLGSETWFEGMGIDGDQLEVAKEQRKR